MSRATITSLQGWKSRCDTGRGHREVWKVGGSVLGSPAAWQGIADCAQSCLEERPDLQRLYIVVSAGKGVTDALLSSLPLPGDTILRISKALASRRSLHPDLSSWLIGAPVARSLLLGEHESALQLRDSFSDSSSVSMLSQFSDYPLEAWGPHLQAEIDWARSRVRFGRCTSHLRAARVVIVTGFGAVNAAGEPVLLGRNASDYVAAALTHLDQRVKRIVFIKDSGALYADFSSGSARLVRQVGSTDVFRIDRGQLLDHRSLALIQCECCIADRSLHVGTHIDAALHGARRRAAL